MNQRCGSRLCANLGKRRGKYSEAKQRRARSIENQAVTLRGRPCDVLAYLHQRNAALQQLPPCHKAPSDGLFTPIALFGFDQGETLP